MSKNEYKFNLLRRATSPEVFVFQLPCLPKRFRDALGWKDGQPLKMKLTKKGVTVVEQ